MGGRYGFHELHTERAILSGGKRQFSEIAWCPVATYLELVGEVAIEVTECLEKALRMAETYSSKPAGVLGERGHSLGQDAGLAGKVLHPEMVWVLVVPFEASLIAEDADA